MVLLGSVESINSVYGSILYILEWFFMIVFTMEYILRVYCVGNKRRYIKSFFGVIDLLTILPIFLSFIFPDTQLLMIVRVIRLLRLFRIFKMVRYVEESGVLVKALKASRFKITVFIFTLVFIVTIIGALMYLVEGGTNGYDSIPQSMYWAIITVTTVGYGDITPHTAVGKFIASMLMILAYGILAVPTGIFSYELAKISKNQRKTCPYCLTEGHAANALYCENCGKKF